jgi:hypothetical protein
VEVEPGQDLELHEAEVAGLAQLLLDRVSEQASHLDEGEVGAELDGVDGPRWVPHDQISLLRIRSAATVRSGASRLKHFVDMSNPTDDEAR